MNNSSNVVDLLRRAALMIGNGNAGVTPSTSTPGTSTMPSTSAPGTSTMPGTGNQMSSSAIHEHRRLFNRQMRIHPYTGRRQNRGGSGNKTSESKEKTIAKTVVCLAERDQLNVPSNRDKIVLRENFLGEKKVAFPSNGSKERIKEVLYEAFPPLKSCGGFEMLLCEEKSRTKLQVVKYGSCSMDEMRCFGTGRIYIRPIQVDITLIDPEDVEEQSEECLVCKTQISLRNMREHMELCSSVDALTNTEELPPAFGNRSDETPVTGDTEPSDSVEEQQDSDESPGDQNQDVSVTAEPAESLQQQARLRDQVPFKDHRRKAIEDTLTSVASCEEPVAVVKEYSRNFMRGRLLDLISEYTLCEGRTIEIFVSRMNLYKDGMAELITEPPLEDVSRPLEVTYTGEEASDYGGPRKEFLGSMMREIRDRLFLEADDGGYVLREDLAALQGQHYYGAGLIFGFSLLQGGPLPSFLKEEQLRTLVDEDSSLLTEAGRQFQRGFDKFGLLEVIRKKPCLLFLMRKTAVLPLSRAKLIKLFQPRFSEEGSNNRTKEEEAYRTFLNYLKEVSAGRRQSVSLEKVLKFATGSESEPVLGYGITPHILFDRHTQSFLPTSNTCINRLTLATGACVPQNLEDAYQFFDYSFSNDYFGNM